MANGAEAARTAVRKVMAKDYRAEFDRIAQKISDMRPKVIEALGKVHGSKDAKGVAGGAELARFGKIHEEWEALLAESRALLAEFRKTFSR